MAAPAFTASSNMSVCTLGANIMPLPVKAERGGAGQNLNTNGTSTSVTVATISVMTVPILAKSPNA